MAEEKPTVPLPGSTPPLDVARDGEDEELAPGARAGAWELLRPIARGGHGTVYVGAHRDGGKRAAVKVLSRRFGASREMVARFAREARILSRLRHPNVVEILELGVLPDGRPFVAMELLHGRSLLELLAARGRLPLAEAVELLAPVCEALDAAHRAGVVHRDVKASNVFVLSGDPPRVKLLDFGVARGPDAGDAKITAVGERLGSAHATAPELIRGDAVDARADVYALGVLLYQLVTGVPPFWSDDVFELERLHLAAPPPKPTLLAPVPPALDAVVERALAKRAEDRFSSAPAFLEALRSAAGKVEHGPERTARAAAIHVALAPSGELDDERALALAALEDDAARRLGAAGFELDLRAGGTFLATRVLPDDARAARRARDAARAFARELHAALSAAAHGEALVAVALHTGDIMLASGGRRAGGPVYRTASWVPAAAEGYHEAITPTAPAREPFTPGP